MDLMNRPPVLRDKVTDWTEMYNSSTLARNFRGAVYLTIKLSPKAPLPLEPPNFFSRLVVMLTFFVRYYMREWGMYRFRIVFLLVGACYICMAQFLASLPFNLVGSVVFQSIYHFMTDVYPVREILAYGIVMTWLHLLMMEACVLCLVATFRNTKLAVTAATILLILFLLFSGFVLAVPVIPPGLRWISTIVPIRVSYLILRIMIMILVHTNQIDPCLSLLCYHSIPCWAIQSSFSTTRCSKPPPIQAMWFLAPL